MDTLTKATTHKVTPTPEGFSVLSGTSGSKYLVVPLSLGGAHCNCPHGRHSSVLATRCTHVRAVEAYAAAVPLPADPFRGFRLPEPAKGATACWLCKGKGQVEVSACSHGSRRAKDPACTEACVRTEACPNCWGRGAE